MNFFHSLRWQLQIWHATLLILVLVGFGATAYRIAWDESQRQVDRELQQHLMSILRRGQPPPGFGRIRLGQRPGPQFEPPKDLPPPPDLSLPFDARGMMTELVSRVEDEGAGSLFVVLWNEKGEVVASSREAPKDVPPFQFADQEGDNGPEPTFRTRGDIREAIIPVPFAGGLVIGRSITEELSAIRQVALSLFGAGVAVLAIGLIGGWLLTARAIRPVEIIEETAAEISKGDLSHRIEIVDAKSELGRVSRALNSTFDRLEVMFQNQARFTSDAAHEFRTPLAVILTQVQSALSRDRTPSEYKEVLEACQRAAQRMRGLTTSLLELARLEAGQEIEGHKQIDLAEIVRECVDLLAPLSNRAGVQVFTDLETAPCRGDHARLAQVVINLATNAIQFTKVGGSIWIKTGIVNQYAQIEVRDDGSGISPENLPFIFERFYRSDAVRTGGQNTGLGLAICKAIVQAHSGTIGASSTPHAGALFDVRLPL
jgi:two-component system, OmpR family, sensor kinase